MILVIVLGRTGIHGIGMTDGDVVWTSASGLLMQEMLQELLQ